MQTQINFIITCFDREAYFPYLKQILQSYPNIKSNICLAYNGVKDDFTCDVKIQNRGHQLGEYDLIKAGYNFHKQNNPDVKLFIKLGVDSWLLDESNILNIQKDMDRLKRGIYAGNFWHTSQHLSTDIFFTNLNYGNIFEHFNIEKNSPEENSILSSHKTLENFMYEAVMKQGGNFHIIEEREPVHPNNRHSVVQLNWVMNHTLDENLQALALYHKKNKQQ